MWFLNNTKLTITIFHKYKLTKAIFQQLKLTKTIFQQYKLNKKIFQQKWEELEVVTAVQDAKIVAIFSERYKKTNKKINK